MRDPLLQWTDEYGERRTQIIVDRIFVGRICKGIEPSRRILINQPYVSRDHALISRQGDLVTVTDMGRNGTFINDVRMPAGATSPLKAGDRIRVGDIEIHLLWDTTPAPGDVVRDDWETTTFVAPGKIHVTNLVADIRGFTGMAQVYDSNLVYSLLKQVFKYFGNIIQRCHGTLNDFAGDAIYAFWEHPQGLDPQKALLACRAALKQAGSLSAIQTKIDAHSQLRGFQLRFGWGITTGQVTISSYTERAADLALVGDATNMAFRLSCLANKTLPRPIVVCARTAELVREHIALDPLGPVTLRGRKGVEQVYGISKTKIPKAAG
jgi:adenylate cyclase